MSKEITVADMVLKAWGAKVSAIPTTKFQEADWLVELPDCRVLIEEKMKFNNDATTAARDAVLSTAEVHGTSVGLGRNNRVSAIVRKAAGQLESTGSRRSHDLRILWFTGAGDNGQAQQEQLISTLYGTTTIVEMGHPQLRTCYFFGSSDFFRYHTKLDGAVAAYFNGPDVAMKLCLNPYSENWQQLRDSSFAALFKDAIIDPMDEEAAGDSLVVDNDMDRADETGVLEYIEKKYGLTKVMQMKLGMLTASIKIDF
jgi:hypothetical protein